MLNYDREIKQGMVEVVFHILQGSTFHRIEDERASKAGMIRLQDQEGVQVSYVPNESKCTNEGKTFYLVEDFADYFEGFLSVLFDSVELIFYQHCETKKYILRVSLGLEYLEVPGDDPMFEMFDVQDLFSQLDKVEKGESDSISF